jgi:hypothetical protein
LKLRAVHSPCFGGGKSAAWLANETTANTKAVTALMDIVHLPDAIRGGRIKSYTTLT